MIICACDCKSVASAVWLPGGFKPFWPDLVEEAVQRPWLQKKKGF